MKASMKTPFVFRRCAMAALPMAVLLILWTDAFADEVIDRALEKYTMWLAIGTGVLAAATLGLVYFAIKQSKDMKKSLEATNALIKQSSDRERAYVFVESVKTSANQWLAGADQFIWHIKLVNHGQTPAIIDSIKAAATVATRRPWQTDSDQQLNGGQSSLRPLDPPDLWEEKIQQPTAIVLAREAEHGPIPCISIRPFSTSGLPDPVHDAVSAGVHRMFWVSGLVKYTDVFGTHHETSFCFALEPRALGKAIAYELERGRPLNVRT